MKILLLSVLAFSMCLAPYSQSFLNTPGTKASTWKKIDATVDESSAAGEYDIQKLVMVEGDDAYEDSLLHNAIGKCWPQFAGCSIITKKDYEAGANNGTHYVFLEPWSYLSKSTSYSAGGARQHSRSVVTSEAIKLYYEDGFFTVSTLTDLRYLNADIRFLVGLKLMVQEMRLEEEFHSQEHKDFAEDAEQVDIEYRNAVKSKKLFVPRENLNVKFSESSVSEFYDGPVEVTSLEACHQMVLDQVDCYVALGGFYHFEDLKKLRKDSDHKLGYSVSKMVYNPAQGSLHYLSHVALNGNKGGYGMKDFKKLNEME